MNDNIITTEMYHKVRGIIRGEIAHLYCTNCKQYKIAPEYIPYMLRERQEKLNHTLQTLWMIRKEFEK